MGCPGWILATEDTADMLVLLVMVPIGVKLLVETRGAGNRYPLLGPG